MGPAALSSPQVPLNIQDVKFIQIIAEDQRVSTRDSQVLRVVETVAYPAPSKVNLRQRPAALSSMDPEWILDVELSSAEYQRYSTHYLEKRAVLLDMNERPLLGIDHFLTAKLANTHRMSFAKFPTGHRDSPPAVGSLSLTLSRCTSTGVKQAHPEWTDKAEVVYTQYSRVQVARKDAKWVVISFDKSK